MMKILLLVAILVAGQGEAMAGGILEAVKGVSKVIGLEVGQEAAEAGGKNVAKSVAKELVQEGSESVAKQTGKVLAKSFGDDVARVASSSSDDLAKGLESLSAQNVRRLQMMSGDLKATGKASEVIKLISNGGMGDQVVDFLWRNKGTIVGGTAITTLLMNPDMVIGATGEIGKVLISTAGNCIALPMVQNAPTMAGVLIVLTLLAIVTLVSVTALRCHPLGLVFQTLKALGACTIRRSQVATDGKLHASEQVVLPMDGKRQPPI